MKLLNDYASQLLIQKIGITLLSSLVIGLLLAVMTGLVLFLTKKSSANVRYNLLTALLCLFTMSVGVVLYQQLFQDSSMGVAGSQVQIASILVNGDLGNVMPSGSGNFKAVIWAFLTANTPTITVIWILIVLFKTMKMAKGLYKLRYLKRNKVYSIGKHWEDRMGDLALKIGINRSVIVMQSGLVKIPMVMGHFKPVILIPLGVITNIPADQIEMILLHELAHIKRMDFFVNLLQHFVELLFFFNPAVLWLSGLIRRERENCCDDMAVRLTGSKKTYINALLSFREYQLAEPVYALAFAKDSSLVERAKRIAFHKNTTLKISEKVFLGVTLLLLFTFSFLIAKVSENDGKETISPGVLLEKTTREGNIVFHRKPVTSLNRSGADSVSNQSIEESKENLAQLAIISSMKSIDSLLKLNSKLLSSSEMPLKLDTVPKMEFEKPLILEPLQSLQPLIKDKSVDSSRYFSNYHGQYSKPAYQFDKKLTLFKTVTLKPAISDQILDEVEKAGVSFDRKHVQFHITNTELIVDGVKQPDGIHKEVVSKFVKKPGDIIDFTFSSDVK